MVPRLVSYARNGTVSTACTIDPRTLAFEPALDRLRARHTGPRRCRSTKIGRCSPESTLFTLHAGGKYDAASGSPWNVAYRTVTPTALGAAYLQQQCASYPWGAGVAQNVTAGGCESLASARAVAITVRAGRRTTPLIAYGAAMTAAGQPTPCEIVVAGVWC